MNKHKNTVQNMFTVARSIFEVDMRYVRCVLEHLDVTYRKFAETMSAVKEGRKKILTGNHATIEATNTEFFNL